MKNLLALVGSEEENRKIEALKKSSLVIALSTLYSYRGRSSDLIIVSYQAITVTFLEVLRDRVGLMFTRREVTAFVGSMRIAGRVVL